jgi:hypothetical protein
MNAEPPYNAVQGGRNDEALYNEGCQGGYKKMSRILNVGLPSDRERQHNGLERENIQAGCDAILV